MKQGYVYILTNKCNGTLYVGVTSNLTQRIFQHKNKEVEGFSKKYNLNLLVAYEVYPTIGEAIDREKKIKKWNRAWKIELIEEQNPTWSDLYHQL